MYSLSVVEKEFGINEQRVGMTKKEYQSFQDYI